MKVAYDAGTDILTVIFRESPVEESDEHRPRVILDYDRQGFLVSVEVLEASKRVQEPTSVIVTTDEG
jgi:uncharacterized protein YuzE